MKDYIKEIKGREILNANGKPTVEAELITTGGIVVTSSVPSGTSAGKYEAYELFDGGNRYGGFGTQKAAENISDIISECLKGMDITKQEEIDNKMCEIDGTHNKEKLGGNAILAVSVAAARAGAIASKLPLYQHISQGKRQIKMPNLIATVMAGGAFSNSGMEFEDYMYVLQGFENFPKELEVLVKLRKHLEYRLREHYGQCLEEGGALSVPCNSTEDAFKWMLNVADELGYRERVSIGLDVAASELFLSEQAVYKLGKDKIYTKESLLDYYKELCVRYPVTLIEDGFDEDDFESFSKLKKEVPSIQVVGDDLFATNTKRLQKGFDYGSANAILLKINQIGTVTEAVKANDLARANGYDVIVSLRSGETTDDFIADLAVGIGARQIKLGSPVRAERNAKYNRLLKIFEEINK